MGSGGRSGGFRRRAGYRTRSDNSGADEAPSPFGLGGVEIGGQGRQYLDQLPVPGWLGGGTLLVSPEGPVDPFDCQRWPGSPYCGELPFSGNFLGLDFSVAQNDCEIVISLEPSVGWWRFPPYEIGHRRCSPPPPPVTGNPAIPGIQFFPHTGAESPCLYYVTQYESGFAVRSTGGPEVLVTEENAGYYWGPILGTWRRAVISSVNASGDEVTVYHSGLIGRGFSPSTFDIRPVMGSTYHTNLVDRNGYLRGSHRTWLVSELVTDQFFVLRQQDAASAGDLAGVSYWQQQRNAFLFRVAPLCYTPPVGDNRPYFPPSTTPPPNNMCNCKALEASLKRIERVLGIPQLYSGGHSGWRVPQKLAGTNTQDTETLDNYATLLNWLIGEIRDSLGDTSYAIKVKDANLLQAGDQGQTINIPNLAEGQAEQLGLLLKIDAMLQATYAAAASSLIQAGNASISSAKAALEIQEVADFLGYSGDEEEFDIPLSFTPGKEAPHEFLRPSTGKGTYRECTEKNDLQIQMRIIQQAADIIRAVYGVRMDSASIDREFDEIREVVSASGGGDIDVILEEIENGFPGAEGNTNTTPYGRPYDQRPRLRIIGRPQGNDGGN